MAPRRILLMSGAIHAGKTYLASGLRDTHGFARISSREYLAQFLPPGLDPNSEAAREALQQTGDRLDRETDYLWVVDPAVAVITAAPLTENWLVDAVRKARQVEHFRRVFPATRHVHLTAPEEILMARHQHSGEHYAKTIAHPNEVSSRALGAISDLTFDTSRFPLDDMVERVMSLWEDE